jgi:hypothetical protein
MLLKQPCVGIHPRSFSPNQIEVTMRCLNSLFKKTNIESEPNPTPQRNSQVVENLIHELFDGSTSRKMELIRATTICVTCLHEAGHVMMAELHKIAIQWINLPRIDNLTSPPRLGETKEERDPGVSIPPVNLNQAVPFLLGGLFGELNVYDDNALANPGSIQVYTYGCRGDFDEITAKIRGAKNPRNYHGLGISIDRARAASRDGAEPAKFLADFPFRTLPDFVQFRQHRERHRYIVAQLYQKWKAADFERLHVVGPQFGAYTY